MICLIPQVGELGSVVMYFNAVSVMWATFKTHGSSGGCEPRTVVISGVRMPGLRATWTLIWFPGCSRCPRRNAAGFPVVASVFLHVGPRLRFGPHWQTQSPEPSFISGACCRHARRVPAHSLRTALGLLATITTHTPPGQSWRPLGLGPRPPGRKLGDPVEPEPLHPRHRACARGMSREVPFFV